jgi:hypothetical protein
LRFLLWEVFCAVEEAKAQQENQALKMLIKADEIGRTRTFPDLESGNVPA